MCENCLFKQNVNSQRQNNRIRCCNNCISVPNQACRNKCVIIRSPCPLKAQQVYKITIPPKVKAEPCKPRNNLISSSQEMSEDTVYKLSYMPFDPQEPVQMPWAKRDYIRPKIKMDTDTVYRLSYDLPSKVVGSQGDVPDIYCFNLDDLVALPNNTRCSRCSCTSPCPRRVCCWCRGSSGDICSGYPRYRLCKGCRRCCCYMCNIGRDFDNNLDYILEK